MGAAAALYSASCYAQGKFWGGNPYPIYLSTIISLSGWLPCSRLILLCPSFLFSLFLLNGDVKFGKKKRIKASSLKDSNALLEILFYRF